MNLKELVTNYFTIEAKNGIRLWAHAMQWRPIIAVRISIERTEGVVGEDDEGRRLVKTSEAHVGIFLFHFSRMDRQGFAWEQILVDSVFDQPRLSASGLRSRFLPRFVPDRFLDPTAEDLEAELAAYFAGLPD